VLAGNPASLPTTEGYQDSESRRPLPNSGCHESEVQRHTSLIAGTRNHRNQIPQNFNLHHSHDGPTFVAPQFDIAALDDRHDAATAIGTG
jgi:hypothetical protein